MPTQQQKLAFVANNYQAASNAAASTGLPLNYVLGQAALESNYGTSAVAAQNNNLFGVKGSGANGYAVYGSTQQSFDGYASLLNNSRYAPAVAATASSGDATAIGNAINAAGYSETPDYGTRVGNTSNEVASILNQQGLNSGFVNPNSGYVSPSGVITAGNDPATGLPSTGMTNQITVSGDGTTVNQVPSSSTDPNSPNYDGYSANPFITGGGTAQTSGGATSDGGGQALASTGSTWSDWFRRIAIGLVGIAMLIVAFVALADKGASKIVISGLKQVKEVTP